MDIWLDQVVFSDENNNHAAYYTQIVSYMYVATHFINLLPDIW